MYQGYNFGITCPIFLIYKYELSSEFIVSESSKTNSSMNACVLEKMNKPPVYRKSQEPIAILKLHKNRYHYRKKIVDSSSKHR
jgi:hypothetical protein